MLDTGADASAIQRRPAEHAHAHAHVHAPERSTHLAPSLKLETAVRFSGGPLHMEHEAHTSNWKSRQEHVEAADFYRMLGRGRQTQESAAESTSRSHNEDTSSSRARQQPPGSTTLGCGVSHSSAIATNPDSALTSPTSPEYIDLERFAAPSSGNHAGPASGHSPPSDLATALSKLGITSLGPAIPKPATLPNGHTTRSPPVEGATDRAELREIMVEMGELGFGNRRSMQLGLTYVMRFWGTVPSRSGALEEKHLKMIIDNLTKPDGNGLAEMSQGFSFMEVCLRLSRVDLAKELIDQGADLKKVSPKRNYLMTTAIWYSQGAGGVQFLIDHGASVHEKPNSAALPPIHDAVVAYNVGAVRALIAAGADVNREVRNYGKSMELICWPRQDYEQAAKDMLTILKMLLDAGSSVRGSTAGAITPALLTGTSGIPGVLEHLRDSGVPQDVLARLQNFVLFASIISGDVNAVRKQIRRGADIWAKGIFNLTPSEFAKQRRQYEIKRVISDEIQRRTLDKTRLLILGWGGVLSKKMKQPREESPANNT
ncbi:hypothetical protein DRE_02610 [Drechslerella stenobrocha 248]|uniref:Uncharacterized protein n=1 Tax=Drechslerella stenobrocha 248 TaxID=1043628 RepID=W7HV32_9PEZI|nr:hypothetical protein DRE_02610 [Drechslerella stenobrocha 248]